MELTIDTIATGWDSIVDLYRGDLPTRIATRHGVSFDLADTTIVIRNPSDLTMPKNYEYPELVKDYLDRLFGSRQDGSLVYQRLHHWQNEPGEPLDQMRIIEELLRRDRNTRAAVFSAWQPNEDLGTAFPISPVDGCFRLIDDVLHLFLTARSTDVIVGLVPELVAWARLISTMALSLGARESRLAYRCWSLHMYEIDYICYLARR